MKRKFFAYLQADNIWLRSSSFDRQETTVIACFFMALHSMVNRQDLAATLNQALQKLTMNAEQASIIQNVLGTPDSDIPLSFVSSRWLHHSNAPSCLSTQALVITCVKAYARMMKELVSQIPDEQLPYWIIPIGMAQMSSQEQCKKYLVANNDQQNILRGIPVIGLHPSCLNWDIKDDKEVPMTMRNFFWQHENIVSTKATNGTKERGRYLVIVGNSKYDGAQTYLSEFFGT